MRWDYIVNEDEIRRTIDVLKPMHQLFEIRILGTDKRKVLSGYFTDAETLISAFDTVDLRNVNVYITINDMKWALYSRTQHDKFVANTNTTSDPEINSYQWLFIDFDPERPTNISSTDEELEFAKESKDTVKKYLDGLGFSEPVEAISGNGYHLLYKINLPNNDENSLLVSNCLCTLAALFNNDRVKVDTTNCNASRICKLHGTLAQKGANTEDRPHRMSRLISVPDEISETPKSVLEKLVAELPQNNANESKDKRKASIPIINKREFDVRDWLKQYGFSYREDVGRDCQMFLLDECPFDHNHKNGDAKIFAYTNGAIAFKCHHNSCKGRTWQDFRTKYEPDAYDAKEAEERIEDGYKKHKQHKEDNIYIPLGDDGVSPVPNGEKKERKKRKLKTAEGLMSKKLREPEVFVGVGEEIPILVEGTCVLSAKPKLGKSWLVLAMCIAISNGDDFIGYKTKKCSTLYLDLETSEQLQQKRIRKALKGASVPKNFYIDTETDNIDNGFVEQIENYLEQDPDIGVVVIDVFQIIRSKPKSSKETEYERCYRDITPLNDLAQKHHLSIILVCHDRKMVDADDPFANILGSTGLQGAATQMMVMFKPRKDDPIHISIKGKTIDGLPDMDVELNDGRWMIVDASNSKEREEQAAMDEYISSDIRKSVIEIVNHRDEWKGRCGELVNEAIGFGCAIVEDNKNVGGFIHRHQGRFLAVDNIKIQIIKNGTGPKIYRICKSTIDTIDETSSVTIDGFHKPSVYEGSEVPFSI